MRTACGEYALRIALCCGVSVLVACNLGCDDRAVTVPREPEPARAGGKPQQAAQSIRELDPQWRQIPAGYSVPSPEAVFKEATDIGDLPTKSEFETVAQHDKRRAALLLERRLANPHPTWVLEAERAVELGPYDAETQQFLVEVSTEWVDYEGDYRKIFVSRRLDVLAQIRLALPVPVKEAPAFAGTYRGGALMALLIFRPDKNWPQSVRYYEKTEPTVEYGGFQSKRTIERHYLLGVSSPLEIWLFDRETRNVLFKYAFRGKQPTSPT